MSKLPIILDENYRLEPDGLQWILRYESKRTETDPDTLLDKVVTSSDQWYHGELRFALRAYCDKVLKPEPTVKALWDKIEELVVKIDTLFALRHNPVVPVKERRKKVTLSYSEIGSMENVEKGMRRAAAQVEKSTEYPNTVEESFKPEDVKDLDLDFGKNPYVALQDTELYKIVDPLEDLY